MIKKNTEQLLAELPKGVQLEAACKTRTPSEIQAAVDAGISILGQNYVGEGETVIPFVSGDIRWHLIGHLQTNKVKRAVDIFHMLESLDSVKLARHIDRASRETGKVMECLIEINSAGEPDKNGVLPESAEKLLKEVLVFPNLKIKGLMTMGPLTDDPEDARESFRITRQIYDSFKSADYGEYSMDILSMGMSSSYKIAVEEGANLVRVGTAIFGSRE